MIVKIIKSIVRIFLVACCGVRIQYVGQMPQSGGVIVCSNHISNFDPMAIGSMLNRDVRFLAKKELFMFAPFGALMRFLGATSVDRGIADTSAVKKCISIVRGGEALLIFPQGTRVKVLTPESIRIGAAKIAKRTGVPIVPVGVCGKYRMFNRTTVRIGHPISAQRIAQCDDDDLRQLLYQEIAALI